MRYLKEKEISVEKGKIKKRKTTHEFSWKKKAHKVVQPRTTRQQQAFDENNEKYEKQYTLYSFEIYLLAGSEWCKLSLQQS